MPKSTQKKNLKLSNEEINKITRNSIQEALIYLLGKKELNDISVTEIVTKAGVSRSAYYRNYKSKEDILTDFSMGVFLDIFFELKSNTLVSQAEKWYQFLFSQVKKNERLVRLIFKAKLPSLLAYLPPIDEDKYDKKEIYQIHALLAALISLVEKWVENDFDLSVDEISALCYELFPHISWVIRTNE